MLSRLFRTKEKFIITIVIITFIVTGIYLYLDFVNSSETMDQAVMAENYLKAGNYEEAVDAYQKALLIKKVDRQLLSIGLADAYVGQDKYEDALYVLRACYKETSGSKVKEKIEEVTAKKLDYDYLQSASRAEIYYSNKEYEKAIAEYENAKKIKSKEVTSYLRITQAYIEMGEYSLAKEEAIEGQELTKDKIFDNLIKTVETYQNKEQYSLLIDQAKEYVTQENYEDGIKSYKKAIKLIPEAYEAYQGLAEIYILQKDYDTAINLLESAAGLTGSEELERLLQKAEELKEAE